MSQVNASGRFVVPTPVNEPLRDYAPGSPERAALESTIAAVRSAGPIDAPMHIGGQ